MVNNLHLLRGMLGSPGRGLLQMNGQPTAQNNRERGANGDLPGFRNWENPAHVEQLAQIWNVDLTVIPLGAADPRDALPVRRTGLDQVLWISATNPAVSLPARAHPSRARREGLLVVQDLYLTETARLADVVLPAAGWGEKTGTFTNAERTVHLSEQAVDPPGEARSDLAIFLDYSARMGFVDQDGGAAVAVVGTGRGLRTRGASAAATPLRLQRIVVRQLRATGGMQWPVTSRQS